MEIKNKAHRIYKRKRDIILWHYTSPEVLWKMLSGEFYATHYRFMNDSAEITYGIQEVVRFFDKGNASDLLRDAAKCLQETDFFLLCFSKEPDSLYHWRSYALDGGFSIGFSYNGMCDVFNNIKHGSQDGIRLCYDLLKCKYLSEDDIAGIMRKTVDKVQKAIEAQFAKYKPLVGKKPDIKVLSNAFIDLFKSLNSIGHLFSKIPARFPALKKPSFKVEEEYRLVITGNDLRTQVEFIGNKPRIKIPTPELAKCIKEVYVSPHGDVKQNFLLAEIAKERFGLNFEIHRSLSSFNGR